jgi:predicted ATP-grasp superfamily ATP-dependent carboligase
MHPSLPSVLLAGMSVRAMAESAAKAGYRVTAVDGFGDLDTIRASDRVLTPRRDLNRSYSVERLITLSKLVTADSFAYGANLENHPAALGRLAAARTLLGNGPAELRLARNPIRLAEILRRYRLAVANVRTTPPSNGEWLLKGRRSGGGRAIKTWREGMPVLRSCYLQERIRGIAASIVFSADGERIVPLAITRQLIGVRWLGAAAYWYSGNILAPAMDSHLPRGEALFERAKVVAEVVAGSCGLKGVNDVDFIAQDGVPFAIEVNPRYSASLELVERAVGVSAFQLHVLGCRKKLPASLEIPRRFPATGKAIVYARRAVIAGETRRWLDDPSIADIPWPGERIQPGHPICTVFASAPSAAECEIRLRARAEGVYSELMIAKGRAA